MSLVKRAISNARRGPDEEDLKKAQDMASKIDGAEVVISVKIGDEGQLFESIHAQQIA